jgi:hypothetical protein
MLEGGRVLIQQRGERMAAKGTEGKGGGGEADGVPSVVLNSARSTATRRSTEARNLEHRTPSDYLPLNSGLRFSTKAVIASVRSSDRRKAAFHTAT